MARIKAKTLTPDRALKGVRKLSRVNGWSVVIISGFGCLLALFWGDLLGLFVGLLIVAAGAMEVHGSRRLARQDADGMTWLVRSQLFLWSVVLVYAVSRIASYDGETALANLTPEMATALQELQIKPEEILPMVQLSVWLGYGAVILVTCIYQGGLAIFYRGRIALVEKAITMGPSVAAAPVINYDQKIYDQIAEEMAENQFRAGLWARALAESDGQEERCKSIYIRLRAAEVSRESNA